ncbi:DUF1516 family protein [Bacillus testis]|uniref:DUF1516 family protein n=1 Tax=Bacillus testis TaxID=1622072 RepID=UPI00067ECA5C|nr:DUF1516 family protein [Bacillus testis]
MGTDFHITTWALAIILMIVAIVLLKKGNNKGFKITHMIVRVLYILIILSGGLLISKEGTLTGEIYGKMILGIIVIGLIEMILVRLGKGKGITAMTVIFIIAFLAVLALGFRLPLGINFLA